MPIRFEYNPIIGGAMAGYAAGRGRAGQRQQKYLLDALEEQKRMALRYGYGAGYGGYGGYGGTRRRSVGGMLEAEPGRWEDPLDAPDAPTRQILAQREANARARRLGKAPKYMGVDQTYVPGRTQDEIDLANEMAKEGRKTQVDRDAELEEDLQTGRLVLSKLGQSAIAEIDADLDRDIKAGLSPEEEEVAIDKANARKRVLKRRYAERPTNPNLNYWVMSEEGFTQYDPAIHARPTHYGLAGQRLEPTEEYSAQMEAEKAAADREWQAGEGAAKEKRASEEALAKEERAAQQKWDQFRAEQILALMNNKDRPKEYPEAVEIVDQALPPRPGAGAAVAGAAGAGAAGVAPFQSPEVSVTDLVNSLKGGRAGRAGTGGVSRAADSESWEQWNEEAVKAASRGAGRAGTGGVSGGVSAGISNRDLVVPTRDTGPAESDLRLNPEDVSPPGARDVDAAVERRRAAEAAATQDMYPAELGGLEGVTRLKELARSGSPTAKSVLRQFGIRWDK